MKKLLVLLLALVFMFAMAGCGSSDSEEATEADTAATEAAETTVNTEDGMIGIAIPSADHGWMAGIAYYAQQKADEMGLKKDDLKKLAQIAKDLGKKLKKAKVSDGYELDLNLMIKGSDDEEDYDSDMVVLKVGGKWVAYNSITSYSQITGMCAALGL